MRKPKKGKVLLFIFLLITQKKDWYKSETGINQVMKEFINIGQLTIDKELDIN